ncbi:MAG: AAA family ATPase, partial [Planctomycetota bacterium]
LEAPCLGVGRTSRVWRGVLGAEFDGLPAGTAVAVKILKEELAEDPEAIATLGYEREASRSVHHPALARSRFLSAGAQAPRARAGHVVGDAGASRPWLVLDLVPGAALDELQVPGSAETAEPLPEPLVRRIGARIAGALAAMHSAGWVHGDVKPENVRLQGDGTAVLVDLGFARRAGAPDGPVGTPLYVAPERAGGGAPVATADLFALGCLLFELGVGAPPARTAAELEALRAGRVPTPSESLPRLSPLFDAIVRALLRASPAARPTARQVAEALEEGESSTWWRDRLDFDPSARRDTVAWAGTHDLPLVGRDAQLAALARAWESAGRDGGSAVLLEGERGSGKSRLVAEFVHRVRSGADHALYLYGRCNAIGDERPAAPLVKLLRRWLHLPSGTTAGPRGRALLFETVRDDVAETLLAALHPTAAVEAAAVSESVALGDWLLALGRLGPTIVFLDDVQYAGEATIAALRRVARDLASTRLLFVLGEQRDRAGPVRARVAEVLERAADRTTRIELGALDEAAVLELVESTFDASVPRLRLARALYERSGGSPGRIKEVLRLARDRGHIRSGSGGGVQLLVDPLDLPSPESVRVLAEERLDELGGPERIWLERAAVVGSRIDLDLVSAAWPQASAARRDAAFGALVRSNWLVPVGAQFRFALPRDRGEVLRTMRPRAHVRAHGAIACALQ